MNATRQIAMVTGIFFVLTFISSIPAVFLYDPVLNDTDYILGSGENTRIYLGAFLEIVLMITNIGTAVALFPILRRQNESVSLGYVSVRIVESIIIGVGIISLLAVVTLRNDLSGATGDEAASLVNIGRSLVAIHDWTFLFGPAFCAGFGNGLLLGFLMYRSGLVPRRMALLGLIGGPLLFASSTAVLFDAYDQTGTIAFVLTGPEILWEASLGIWLIAKGFAPSPITGDLAPA